MHVIDIVKISFVPVR